MTTLFTIGFTRKPAETFFGLLVNAGVRQVIDTRLHNTSQLSGFAKQDDLSYFLQVIGQIDYVHMPNLSPTEDILSDYKKKRITWSEYEESFNQLLHDRQIETLDPGVFDWSCLLCSEHEPDQCHRRLVAEYLDAAWGNVEIVHLW